MNKFFWFVAGAALTPIGYLIIGSQYSDYRARAQSDELFQYTRELLKKHRSSKDIDLTILRLKQQAAFKDVDITTISEGTVLLMKSKKYDQLLVMYFDANDVAGAWKCRVGPTQASPSICN